MSSQAAFWIAAVLAPSPTLTYRGTAPLGRLIPELARRTGRSLASSPSVDADVVALSVRGVDPGDALARLARVAGAEWREEAGGVRRLVRPPGMPDRARRTREARAALAFLAPPRGQSDEEAARAYVAEATKPTPDAFDRLPARTPTGRLHARLLSAVGPEAIAAIPPGGRAVYSDAPNARQLPLPRVDGDLVSAQRVFLRELARSPDAVVFSRRREEFPAPPARTLLLVTVPSEGPPVSRLLLADGLGETLDTSDLTLRAPLTPAGEDPPGSGPLLSPRPEATALQALAWVADSSAVVTPETFDLLRRPLEFDPLDSTAGDPLFRAAEGRNVVALLADAAVHDPFFYLPEPTPASTILRNVASGSALRTDGDWLEMAPTDPDEVRRTRTSRATLDALARSAGRSPLDLEGRAAIAWRFRDDAGKPLANTYWRAMRRLGEPSHRTPFAEPGWVVYGSLDAASRRRAEGEGMPLSALPPEARRAVEGAYLGSTEVGTVGEEPTERFPRGLPLAARVRIRSEGGLGLRTEGDRLDGRVRPSGRETLTMEEVGEREFAARRPDFYVSVRIPHPPKPGGRPFRWRRVVVSLTWGDAVLWRAAPHAWEWAGPDSEIGALPRPWREALAASLAEQERRYQSGERRNLRNRPWAPTIPQILD